jgi:hypothetical protein
MSPTSTPIVAHGDVGEQGREWWGTFVFTISIEGGAVGILASETD